MSAVLSMGFLFGFPLGAKTAAEAYRSGQLSKPQAQYLLAFSNNIGPAYLLSFALPFLGISETVPALRTAVILVFFGLPLFYGLAMRYTVYRRFSFCATASHLSRLSGSPSFIHALDDAVTSACAAITRLGGYMVFFIVCSLPVAQFKHWVDASFPKPLPPAFPALIAPILEITSGLSLSKDALPTALSMTFLTFGGLSCFAQTYTCIRGTGLSFRNYCFHKLLQSAIAFCLYALLFSFFSD